VRVPVDEFEHVVVGRNGSFPLRSPCAQSGDLAQVGDGLNESPNVRLEDVRFEVSLLIDAHQEFHVFLKIGETGLNPLVTVSRQLI